VVAMPPEVVAAGRVEARARLSRRERSFMESFSGSLTAG
jgi:hypothetical protein